MCELGFVHSRLTRPPLASSALFVVACTLQDENSKISIVACDWWPGFILWGMPPQQHSHIIDFNHRNLHVGPSPSFGLPYRPASSKMHPGI